MVECELIYHKSIFSVDKVLIDTWWNVNVGLILLITWCIIVLIDTWWNVNEKEDAYIYSIDRVLIDTWWNVNTGFGNTLKEIIGFNRYMVECEFLYLMYIYYTRKF